MTAKRVVAEETVAARYGFGKGGFIIDSIEGDAPDFRGRSREALDQALRTLVASSTEYIERFQRDEPEQAV